MNSTEIFVLYFCTFSHETSHITITTTHPATPHFSANKTFEQGYKNEQSFLNVGPVLFMNMFSKSLLWGIFKSEMFNGS